MGWRERWSSLSTGLTGGSATALSMAVFNGQLCVAGSFSSAGGIASTNLAMWNGASWSSAGNLNSTSDRGTAAGGKLYVGGEFLDRQPELG